MTGARGYRCQVIPAPATHRKRLRHVEEKGRKRLWPAQKKTDPSIVPLHFQTTVKQQDKGFPGRTRKWTGALAIHLLFSYI